MSKETMKTILTITIFILLTIDIVHFWINEALRTERYLKNEVSKLNNNLKLLNKMKNKEEVK